MKDSNLPKGLRIDRGYLQVRIMNGGKLYIKNFGPDSSAARSIAAIHLSEKRKEILMGKFNIPLIQEKLNFREVATIYVDRWGALRTPEGQLRHSPKSIKNVQSVLNKSLIPYFGKMGFADIAPKDVLSWRQFRVRTINGTSVNREQNVLSSLFNHMETWVKTEEIKAYEIPGENPCLYAAKAQMKKRDRVVTSYEISKLKLAARTLGDLNGEQHIAHAVKTCLSLKDQRRLALGDAIDLNRSKTGMPVQIPITVMYTPDWHNWRKRWEAIRLEAKLPDIEWRDLRKAGINLLQGKFDIKLVSLYAGHADQKTTEGFYTKRLADQMAPIALELCRIVDSL